jgi:hypothetical protein
MVDPMPSADAPRRYQAQIATRYAGVVILDFAATSDGHALRAAVHEAVDASAYPGAQILQVWPEDGIPIYRHPNRRELYATAIANRLGPHLERAQ